MNLCLESWGRLWTIDLALQDEEKRARERGEKVPDAEKSMGQWKQESSGRTQVGRTWRQLVSGRVGPTAKFGEPERPRCAYCCGRW